MAEKTYDTITKEDIMEYARKKGKEQGYFLLLLGGPDWFDGSYDEYQALLAELEEE